MSMGRFALFAFAAILALAGCRSPAPVEKVAASAAPAAAAPTNREERIARSRSLELPTPYVPPPGDPMSHHASGLAKVVCSAVFVTGLDAEFAAQNLGYTAPFPERAKLGKPVVDRAAKSVTVSMPNGLTRTARFLGSQGCATLPEGATSFHFSPVEVRSALPPASTLKWPMGDLVPADPLPPSIDAARLKQAVDAAFEPAGAMTAAYVVTLKGRIIAERYAEGITPQTRLESWSMGKSTTAALMGILIQQGVYGLWQPAPIPEWKGVSDGRDRIRIADLLRMSSGLRCPSPLDSEPDLGTYLDHLYLYTGGVDSFHYAATRPLQWPPGTVGRYRNCDVSLTNYLIRLAVERRGEEYLSFPQRALFDKIGIRSMVLETDPYGNFLLQGYDYGTARDWARLGNLFLQDGVWNAERILPAGYVEFLRTPAPAWVADGRPLYGGFFWLNRVNLWPGPEDAYTMAGAGSQYTTMIPTHDLVIVRMGHLRGEEEGTAALKRALEILLQAVPRSR